MLLSLAAEKHERHLLATLSVLRMCMGMPESSQ